MSREPQRIRARKAVTDAEKTERREAILGAAERHLRAVGVEAFSMEALARDLGFARGTLYRYFATREEVLLALYQLQLASWCDAMLLAVKPAIGERPFIDVFLSCATADALFLELQARLESVIEQNVSMERLVEAKREMRENLERVSEHLAKCLGLDPAQARGLIVGLAALLLGAAQMDTAPVARIDGLPDDLRAASNWFDRDSVFRDNAIRILDGIRHRPRPIPSPREQPKP